MSFGRGRGHLQDINPGQDKTFGSSVLMRSASPAPAACMRLLDFARYDFNQDQSSSCVGFGTRQNLWVLQESLNQLLTAAGKPTTPSILASALDVYAKARLRGKSSLLVDAGCYPRNAWDGLAELGWCPEDAWPFSMENVTREPSWAAEQAAADHMNLSYYRIDTVGPARAVEVRQAIFSGRPVSAGLTIDAAFEAYDSGTWDGPDPRQILGGHYITILGYDGPDAYWCVNQWAGWGLSGRPNLFCISANALTQTTTSDLYVAHLSGGGLS